MALICIKCTTPPTTKIELQGSFNRTIAIDYTFNNGNKLTVRQVVNNTVDTSANNQYKHCFSLKNLYSFTISANDTVYYINTEKDSTVEYKLYELINTPYFINTNKYNTITKNIYNEYNVEVSDMAVFYNIPMWFISLPNKTVQQGDTWEHTVLDTPMPDDTAISTYHTLKIDSITNTNVYISDNVHISTSPTLQNTTGKGTFIFNKQLHRITTMEIRMKENEQEIVYSLTEI